MVDLINQLPNSLSDLHIAPCLIGGYEYLHQLGLYLLDEENKNISYSIQTLPLGW